MQNTTWGFGYIDQTVVRLYNEFLEVDAYPGGGAI